MALLCSCMFIWLLLRAKFGISALLSYSNVTQSVQAFTSADISAMISRTYNVCKQIFKWKHLINLLRCIDHV